MAAFPRGSGPDLLFSLALALLAALGCAIDLDAARRTGFYRCAPSDASVGPVIEYHSDTLHFVETRHHVFVTVFAINLDREVTLSSSVARWYDCEQLSTDPQEVEIAEPYPL